SEHIGTEFDHVVDLAFGYLYLDCFAWHNINLSFRGVIALDLIFKQVTRQQPECVENVVIVDGSNNCDAAGHIQRTQNHEEVSRNYDKVTDNDEQLARNDEEVIGF